jgi:hypothetical protein
MALQTYDPLETYEFKETAFPFGTTSDPIPASLDATNVTGLLPVDLGTNAPAGWINADAVGASALDGKGDWNTVTPDAAGTAATLLGALETHGDLTWATATGFAVAGDAMTLTAAYDAAKTAAQADTALSTAVWTNTKAGYLDAAVSTAGGGATPEQMYSYFTDGTRANAFKATGFATPTNVTDARDVIVVHLEAIKGTGWTDESLKSLQDAVTLIVGGTGGAFTQTVTVTDGTNPIQGATVDILSGTTVIDSKTTNALGVAAPSCNAGTFTLRVTRIPLYGSSSQEITVSAAGSYTVPLTLLVVTPPPSDDTSTVRIYTRLGGVVTGGLLVQLQQREIKTGSTGYGDSSEVRELRSNGSGYVDFTCLRNAEHRWRMGRSGQWVTFTPTTATYVALGSDVGHE